MSYSRCGCKHACQDRSHALEDCIVHSTLHIIIFTVTAETGSIDSDERNERKQVHSVLCRANRAEIVFISKANQQSPATLERNTGMAIPRLCTHR